MHVIIQNGGCIDSVLDLILVDVVEIIDQKAALSSRVSVEINQVSRLQLRFHDVVAQRG